MTMSTFAVTVLVMMLEWLMTDLLMIGVAGNSDCDDDGGLMTDDGDLLLVGDDG